MCFMAQGALATTAWLCLLVKRAARLANMHARQTSYSARYTAVSAVAGEAGCAGLAFIALATGAGVLLDFQVTKLHPIFSVGLLFLSIPAGLYWTIRRTLSMDRKVTPTYVRNLALASMASQAGCLSLILIFMALFAGLFLDSRLDTHPIFTILLIVISIPVSLWAMIRMMLSSVAAMKLSAPDTSRTAPSFTGKSVHTKENGS